MTPTKIINTSYVIQTPLLKMLLRFFGNLSVQLYPVRVDKWRTLLSCAFNLALLVSFFLQMTTRQSNYYRSRFQSGAMLKAYHEKPLFRLIVTTIMRRVFLACYFARALYFLKLSLSKKASDQLIYLLDQISLLSGCESTTTKRKVYLHFALIVCAQQLFFFLSLAKVVYNMSKNGSVATALLQYITMHTLGVNSNMAFFIIFYYQTATLQSFKRIVKCFKETENLDALQNEIAHLASLNTKLNRLISAPCILSLIPYIVQMLIAFTCVLIGQNRDTNTFAAQYISITAVIAYLDYAIEGQLLLIEQLVWAQLKGKQYTGVLFKKTKYSEKIFTGSQLNCQCLQWNEFVPLYRKCFKLRIFNFFSINWKFLFLLGVFLCNLVVLISQTTA